LDIENKDQEEILSGVLKASNKKSESEISQENEHPTVKSNNSEKLENSLSSDEINPFSGIENLQTLSNEYNEELLFLRESFKITPFNDIEIPKDKELEIRNSKGIDNDGSFNKLLADEAVKKEKRSIYLSQPKIKEFQNEVNKLGEYYEETEEVILNKISNSPKKEYIDEFPKIEKLETSLNKKDPGISKDTEGSEVSDKSSEPLVEKNIPVNIEKKDTEKSIDSEGENKKENIFSFAKKNLKSGVEETLGFSLDNVKNRIKGKKSEEIENDDYDYEDDSDIIGNVSENEPYKLDSVDSSNLNNVSNETEDPIEQIKSIKEEPIKLSQKNPEKSLLQQSILANKTESELPSASRVEEIKPSDSIEFSPESNINTASPGETPGKNSYESLEKKMEEMVNIMREIRTALRSPLLMKNVDRNRDY
jgi:hypothetical protein